MLKMFKNKKAQNTAEYAILIALVIGGVIAMQTYAQRALQGRVRDASIMLTSETSELGNTYQYEPYYQNTFTDTDRISESIEDVNAFRTTTNTLSQTNEFTIYKNADDGNF
jgi:hypothetical protein